MKEFKKISVSDAQEKLKQTDTLLIDIRDTESFEDGHIHSSINLTQENIGTFVEQTAKHTPILVLCYHGNSSQNVAHYLTLQGFEDVSSINGGYEGWKLIE